MGGLAYGSRARDQSPDRPDEPDNRLEQVKTFLKNRLSPEDFARLEQMMQALAGGGEGEEDNGQNENDRREQMSASPSGVRPPGGREQPDNGEPRRFAQDARGSSYFDAFPMNAKVGTSNYGG